VGLDGRSIRWLLWVKLILLDQSCLFSVPEGLIFSFPVEISNKEWKIVQGLELDDFAKSKIKITTDELLAERDEALSACEASNI
jgi:malate dehydrogenase